MSITMNGVLAPNPPISQTTSTSSAASSLPLPLVSQLESLKFKSTQIIDSIISLQRLIEAGGHNALPTWPDILAKYSLLLSQTHTFSSSLTRTGVANLTSNVSATTGSDAALANNPFAKLVLHPALSLPEAQLDNELIPLIRNQQTTQVLKLESDTVRRLSSRLNPPPPTINGSGAAPNPSPESVLTILEQIKKEHDSRCARAVRAVSLLRDKYDWKARVDVELEGEEEPEFAVPISPLLASTTLGGSPGRAASPSLLTLSRGDVANGDNAKDVEMPDADEDASMNGEDDEEDEEEELEEVLGPSMNPETPSTPMLDSFATG